MLTGPINLAQAVYSFGMGGSERLAWQIASALNRRGRYRCLMYAVEEDGPMAGMLAAEGIPSRSFSRRRKLDVPLIVRLASRFRRDGVQVVHTHHVGQLLNAGVAGRLAGAKVVHTEHEFYSLTRGRTRFLLRALSTLAHGVTGVSGAVTQFLRCEVGIPASKLATVANGVDIARFECARGVDRSVLGCDEDDVLVGCIARLEPEKGHRVLLEAFSRVRSDHPCAKLWLIGDGGEGSRLRTRAEELGLNGSVRFLGMREDVQRWIAACDVIALASTREGLPMVVLEAMAAGKPVVATAVGAVSEAVQDGSTGVLVPPGDVDALETALKGLITAGERRRAMGQRAVARVKSLYSFERSLEAYEAIYDELSGVGTGGDRHGYG